MYSIHHIPSVVIRSIYGDSGVIKSTLFLFVVPIVFVILAYAFSIRLSVSFLSVVVPSMTLFVGFSMNAVVLMLRYAERSDASPGLIEQVRNISVYLIMLGILLLFAALFGIIASGNANLPVISMYPQFTLLLSAIYVGLLVHFFTVALLFPVRIFVIVENIGGNGSENPEEDETGETTRRSHGTDTL